MGDILDFPFRHKRPYLIPFRPRGRIELSPEDVIFQATIREQSAQLRALRAAQRPNLVMPSFSHFWERFQGVSDCGAPTGSPIDE